MKQFLRVLVGILIVGAVGFGIYSILPEHPHNFVKSFVQPIVNSRAKELIGQVQNIKNKDLNDATYKDLLEANNSVSCWVYETREEEPGAEYVIYQGSGVNINLKDYVDYDGKLYTSSEIKFEFKVTGNNVDIYPYIDDVKMYQDGQDKKEDNDKIRIDILKQLSTGVVAE